ncbi:MAG: hypothetical protein GX038_01675 [Erysipelothrix sp.]|nr:hypothetical protein [Erysipelothrix sp.]
MDIHINKKNTDHYIFMLHGTGGNSQDLRGIAEFIDPDATLIGVDGSEFENGMRRYFKRYPDGTFDLDNLKENTDILHQVITQVIEDNNAKSSKITAFGYSNGANILSNLMKEYESLPIDNVILFHPSSAREEVAFKKNKAKVFMTSGLHDPFVTQEEFMNMKQSFENSGIVTEIYTHDAGHGLIHEELELAKKFVL